ncbi:MAG: hypothetical protein IJB36_00815 [Clostridia bacterium]|nr:hypothetical protein [Clostridia bacterium]
MIRKSIALLLALTLLLCGTACGKQTAEKPTDSNADDNPPASVVIPDYTIEDYLAAIDRGDYETVLVWLAQYADTDILNDERIVDFLNKIAILPVEIHQGDQHDLYSYDEKGHLIKIESVYDGEHSTHEYPHDEHGNLIDEDIIREYDANGNVVRFVSTKVFPYESVFTYNDKQQLVREEYTYEGSEPVVCTYTYNENGQLLAFRTSNGNYRIYTYDEDGRLIGQEYDNPEPRKATFFYDEEGRYLGYRSASLSGDSVRETTYTYYTYDGKDYVLTYKDANEDSYIDETIYTYEKDRLISEKRIRNGETISETVYTYNEDGRLLNKNVSHNGEMYSESAYTYQDGKLVSITETRNNGNVTEYTYTYNENGDIATISAGDITYNGYGVCTSFIIEEADIRRTYRVMYYPDGLPECLPEAHSYTLNNLVWFRGVPEAPQAEMPIIPTDELPYGVIKFY